ncbi:hypothetical protein LCGC14_2800430, partial [marine sediment metagenome]
MAKPERCRHRGPLAGDGVDLKLATGFPGRLGEKRQAQMAQLQQQQATLQSQLGQVNTLIMKVTGALEQLDELDGSVNRPV